MIKFNEEELLLVKKLEVLKREAGSHSPSIFTVRQRLAGITVKVDACFLSNPYATDLFIAYLEEEMVSTGKIRELLEFYPSQNAVIAEILSGFLQISAANIFIGNGAIEIIQAIVQHFAIRKVLINIPTFSSYYEFVSDGVEVVYHQLLKEENYALHVERYIELVKLHRPDTLVLINPNNPNGGYTKIAEIEQILNELSFVAQIIVDESFIHFAYESESYQLMSLGRLIEAFPNLIVVKSMSKDFGIAGIRAGYAIMREDYVHRLLRHGYLWNSNGLAEYFFRLYVRSDFASKYEAVRVRYIRETIAFVQGLMQLPHIRVYPSMANFVLIELPRDIKAAALVAKLLLSYGVYVRTCADKIGLDGEFIRLASRSREENSYIIESLKACLEACTVLDLIDENTR